MFVSGPILIPASLKKNFDVELKLILLANDTDAVSYTHLTLPTNREV